MSFSYISLTVLLQHSNKWGQGSQLHRQDAEAQESLYDSFPLLLYFEWISLWRILCSTLTPTCLLAIFLRHCINGEDTLKCLQGTVKIKKTKKNEMLTFKSETENQTCEILCWLNAWNSPPLEASSCFLQSFCSSCWQIEFTVRVGPE